MHPVVKSAWLIKLSSAPESFPRVWLVRKRSEMLSDLYDGNQVRIYRELDYSTFRRHKCKLCPFVTHNRASMYSHRKAHRPGPLFECAECGEGFRGRKVHIKHMETKHPTRTYKCDECAFETTRSDKFR